MTIKRKVCVLKKKKKGSCIREEDRQKTGSSAAINWYSCNINSRAISLFIAYLPPLVLLKAIVKLLWPGFGGV